MKTIYLDTEFSEGFFKPIHWLPKWFPGNKPRWSIELISIGLVDDAGKEYYAINKDFKTYRCNDWVKKNVLTKLPEQYVSIHDSPRIREESLCWKSIDRIRKDIIDFVNPGNHFNKYRAIALENLPIQFKAYYADYDWVLFCTIFGTMMDLPDGFPMYAIDLKQTLDEAQIKFDTDPGHRYINEETNLDQTGTNWVRITIDNETKKELSRSYPLEKHPKYPKQDDEHSSISDARFNKQLDEFIATL